MLYSTERGRHDGHTYIYTYTPQHTARVTNNALPFRESFKTQRTLNTSTIIEGTTRWTHLVCVYSPTKKARHQQRRAFNKHQALFLSTDRLGFIVFRVSVFFFLPRKKKKKKTTQKRAQKHTHRIHLFRATSRPTRPRRRRRPRRRGPSL